MMNNICFIDFETSGTNVFYDEPIELGGVLIDKNRNVINTFFSKIQIPQNIIISKSASKIHKYENNDLKNEPNGGIVLNNFFMTMGTNYCFGGWNISFDVPYLRKLCYNYKRMEDFDRIDYHHLDIQSLVKLAVYLELLPKNIDTLDKCCEHFRINRNIKHNALEDAQIAFQVFKKVLDVFEKSKKQIYSV